MGKSRAWRRSKDDQKMDTDEAPKGGAGVVSMEDDADVIDDGDIPDSSHFISDLLATFTTRRSLDNALNVNLIALC